MMLLLLDLCRFLHDDRDLQAEGQLARGVSVMSSSLSQNLLDNGLINKSWCCMALVHLFKLLCCHRGQETSMGGEGTHPSL